ncbi:MAG: hypothetical protein CM15mP102_22520 [Flavobacteriales bacterium]|nr:MAG: hypothetical protein CM15mP102_22520 [Flavobacteriales bacterium]
MLDNDLYLLNDGYEFTVDDLESLSRSAYSNKSEVQQLVIEELALNLLLEFVSP